jgi:hypothetical protein
MADAHALLEQYVAAHSAGQEADPREWLDRLPEGTERAKLAALIDAYLERAPMRAWDADAFRDSGLAPFAERVNSTLYSEAGRWPAVLPALREKARVRRSELVARLAAALGVAGKEAKVGRYYHEMEHGLLPSEGVDDRVLDALGAIVGQSGAALRRAGEALRGGGEVAAESVAPSFARTGRGEGVPLGSAADGPAEEEWDEVDQLFRGP